MKGVIGAEHHKVLVHFSCCGKALSHLCGISGVLLLPTHKLVVGLVVSAVERERHVLVGSEHPSVVAHQLVHQHDSGRHDDMNALGAFPESVVQDQTLNVGFSASRGVDEPSQKPWLSGIFASRRVAERLPEILIGRRLVLVRPECCVDFSDCAGLRGVGEVLCVEKPELPLVVEHSAKLRVADEPELSDAGQPPGGADDVVLDRLRGRPDRHVRGRILCADAGEGEVRDVVVAVVQDVIDV